MAVWMETRTGRARGMDAPAQKDHRGPALSQRIWRLAMDPRRAAFHLATVVTVAALSGLPGNEASPLVYAWVALALLDLTFTSGWRRMLSGHGEDADFTPPPAGGIVMTGSISSTVKLDYDAGTAEKTYAPGPLVRAQDLRRGLRLQEHATEIAGVVARAREDERHRRLAGGKLARARQGLGLVEAHPAQQRDVRPERRGAQPFREASDEALEARPRRLLGNQPQDQRSRHRPEHSRRGLR